MSPDATRSGNVWRTLGFALLAVALVLVSYRVHCQTALARRAVRGLAMHLANTSSRGTLSIDEVTEFGTDRVAFQGYRITAPSGATVITVERLSGEPVMSSLFGGTIHLRDVRFEQSTSLLSEGPGGQVDLVWASEVPDDRSGPNVVLERIEMVDGTIVVDLPGKPRLRMSAVSGLAHLRIGRFYQWRMDRVSGNVELPVLGEVAFSDMSGRLKSDHAHPLIVDLVVDIGVADPHVHLDYSVPALAGGEGDPHLDLDLPSGLGGSEDGEVEAESQQDADEDSDEDVDEDSDERADEDADADEDVDESADEAEK